MGVKGFFEPTLQWLLTSGIRILIIVVLTFIALRMVQLLSSRIFTKISEGEKDREIQKRFETLSAVIRYIFNITIIGISVVMILGELGVKIGPILAAAGIVGLAIGFGAQSLVQDVISGFFILLENQIRVGDVVAVADKSGLVEKVNLRMVVLRDLAGNVHYVRNGQIQTVTNMTKDYGRYVFDIGIAYREDVDEVIEIVKQVDEELRNDPAFMGDILEPIEILGLDQFANSAVIIKARTKTKPIRQWAVGREFNRRLKMKFDEKGIEIPFPHLTLYLGQDKLGESAPLNISMRQRS